MAALFLKVLNISIVAGWLVLAVVVVRLLLKKAPRWLHVLLWGLVAVRLLWPVFPESSVSMIPSSEVLTTEIMTDPQPSIHTGISVMNNSINPVILHTFAPEPGDSVNPLQVWTKVAAVVWAIGVTAMATYTLISYIRLRRRVSTAVLLRENIYQSEFVDSPFVLGLIKPRIYLPFTMGENANYVIAHEQAHIRRRDHWWKPLGFALLAVHWFNPLMWLAYILLCRDIELACDEKVIQDLDTEQRADYSQALVFGGTNRKTIAACPLAFGEVGVRQRVKSVLHYKKPALWIMLAAVIVLLAVALCFLTNPRQKNLTDLQGVGVALEDARKIQVGYRDNLCEYAASDNTFEELKKIQISSKPVSQDRSENRDQTYQIILDSKVTICISADFTQCWVNDGVKPSLSYEIENPELMDSILDRLIPDRWVVDRIYAGIYADGSHWFFASILEIGEGRILVEPYEGTPEASLPGGEIWVYTDFLPPEGCEALYIVYDGKIEAGNFLSIHTVSSIMGVMTKPMFTSEIDSVTYDIDRDGRLEICSLGYGPTSGLFTFTLSAREVGTEDLEYHNIFNTEHYYLSFETDEAGTVRVRGETQGENPTVHLFDISIEDGYIVLSENGKKLAYWGAQRYSSAADPQPKNIEACYEITQVGYNYAWCITDRYGRTLHSGESFHEPNIDAVDENVVRFSLQEGTGLSTCQTVYYNVDSGANSETFTAVLGEYGSRVIACDYDGENHYITVREMFAPAAGAQRILLEGASQIPDPVAVFEMSGSGVAKITYWKGEDCREAEMTIHMDD